MESLGIPNPELPRFTKGPVGIFVILRNIGVSRLQAAGASEAFFVVAGGSPALGRFSVL